MATPLVSLGELSAHLNLSAGDTTDTAELNSTLVAATSALEARVGPITPRTVTHTVRAVGGTLLLPLAPVISVTSVTGAGAVVSDLALLSVNASAGTVSGVRSGSYTVTYQVGRNPVPDELRWASLSLAAHMWETQRGQASTRPGMVGNPGEPAGPPRGFALPNRVLELIEPYMVPAVA